MADSNTIFVLRHAAFGKVVSAILNSNAQPGFVKLLNSGFDGVGSLVNYLSSLASVYGIDYGKTGHTIMVKYDECGFADKVYSPGLVYSEGANDAVISWGSQESVIGLEDYQISKIDDTIAIHPAFKRSDKVAMKNKKKSMALPVVLNYANLKAFISNDAFTDGTSVSDYQDLSDSIPLGVEKVSDIDADTIDGLVRSYPHLFLYKRAAGGGGFPRKAYDVLAPGYVYEVVGYGSRENNYNGNTWTDYYLEVTVNGSVEKVIAKGRVEAAVKAGFEVSPENPARLHLHSFEEGTYGGKTYQKPKWNIIPNEELAKSLCGYDTGLADSKLIDVKATPVLTSADDDDSPVF